MIRPLILSAALAILTVAGAAGAELAPAARILVDFGPANDDDGRATVNPDVNGNYWNSWRPEPGGTPITIGETYPTTIVDVDNNPTSIAMVMTNSFNSNGRKHGGLLTPYASVLGNFAIGTATEDYWYESVSGAAIRISGLSPNMTYDMRLFGSRVSTTTRITRYTVADMNGSQYRDLQTSGLAIGAGGYSGNNNTIVGFTGLVPNAAGELDLDVAVVTGGYAYLNIMELIVRPGLTYGPDPMNGEHGIDVNADLTWSSPVGVDPPSYDVYLGTNPGTLSLVSEGQGETTYDPCELQTDTDYQWRVDVNYSGTIHTGQVWRFSTKLKQPATIYLCAGQSNMRGRALESEIPVAVRGPHNHVRAFWKDWIQWDDLQIGMGNTGRFGPTFVFGQDMADYSTDENIAIIKYAVDGTDLYTRWRPPSSGGTQGDLYTDFIDVVPYALEQLSLAYIPEIAGMIWFQGSSDSNVQVRALEYEQNLTNLIQDLRAEFNVPEMPVIIGKLKVNPSAMPYGDIVLQAQENVDIDVPHTGSFPTQDLTFVDSVHYDTNSTVAGGQRFASLMAQVRFAECVTLLEFDIDVAVNRTRTYFDLKKSDDVYEELAEIDSGSCSLLEAKWSTYIPPTRNAVFNIEAHHSANAEGDDFVLSYSMDDITYTDMLTVTKTSDDDAAQSYSLPNGLEGILYIRAIDSDRTTGNSTPDTLSIDMMNVYSKAGCDGLAGDFNRDCYVNLHDLAGLTADWQGSMTFDDLADLASNWLECNGSANVSCGL